MPDEAYDFCRFSYGRNRHLEEPLPGNDREYIMIYNSTGIYDLDRDF